jgi:hypothetical protein
MKRSMGAGRLGSDGHLQSTIPFLGIYFGSGIWKPGTP